MKTFEKNYIGKGKQVQDMDIIRISLKLENILKYVHEYEGEKYISFEVAKLQNEDKFDNTHTVYVNKKVDKDEPQEKEPETKGKKASKTAKPSKKDNDEIPF